MSNCRRSPENIKQLSLTLPDAEKRCKYSGQQHSKSNHKASGGEFVHDGILRVAILNQFEQSLLVRETVTLRKFENCHHVPNIAFVPWLKRLHNLPGAIVWSASSVKINARSPEHLRSETVLRKAEAEHQQRALERACHHAVPRGSPVEIERPPGAMSARGGRNRNSCAAAHLFRFFRRCGVSASFLLVYAHTITHEHTAPLRMRV